MAISQRRLDWLNARIDRALTGLDRDAALIPNYTTVSGRRAVLDALEARGWTLTMWSDRFDGTVTGSINSAAFFRLEHRSTVEVTRDPEHQARLEARGDVAPGANTYQRSVVRRTEGALGGGIRNAEDEAYETIDTRPVAAMRTALLALEQG